MAAELPYFRFYVSEWMNGDIDMETLETKGLFIDICAWYWFKDCSVTKAMLEKKFPIHLEGLYNSGVIKLNDQDVVIEFLNEQYDVLSEKRKARQAAGSKGGKQKSSNAKAKVQQSSSYKYKDNNKDKDKKEEIYRAFAHLSITKSECNKLAELKFTKQSIDSILDSIENYKENAKYKSLFLTAKKWLEKDRADADKSPKGSNLNAGQNRVYKPEPISPTAMTYEEYKKQKA